jgi:pre-mRNA-splicing factor CWC26
VRGHEVKESLEKSRTARALALRTEESDKSVSAVHRVGGRVVTRQEWDEQRKREDPRYQRQLRRERDMEFEKKQDVSWKRGLEQSSERKDRAEEALRIAQMPLGHHSNEGIEQELRKKQRWDDPMARIGSKPSMEIEKPRCRFQAPPNRFSIPPGYRWDGVVRGSDFERRWFERANEVRSKKQGQYRLSGDD